MTTVVFDTTAISHFARAARLDTLAALTEGHERLIPNEVAIELQRGTASHPAIADGLNRPWITIVELDFPEVVHAASFKAELGGSPTQHLGECAVLAWVKQHGGVAIVDDVAATVMAKHHRVPVRGTLSLIMLGHKEGILDRPTAETLIDELAATDMRLPTNGSGLFTWAYEEGLLP